MLPIHFPTHCTSSSIGARTSFEPNVLCTSNKSLNNMVWIRGPWIWAVFHHMPTVGGCSGSFPLWAVISSVKHRCLSRWFQASHVTRRWRARHWKTFWMAYQDEVGVGWGTVTLAAWCPDSPEVIFLCSDTAGTHLIHICLSFLAWTHGCSPGASSSEMASSTEPSMQLCVRGGSLTRRCKYKKLQVGDLSWELLLGWDGSRWECPGMLLSWVCTLFALLWSSSLCTSSPWAPVLIDNFSMQLLISCVIPC